MERGEGETEEGGSEKLQIGLAIFAACFSLLDSEITLIDDALVAPISPHDDLLSLVPLLSPSSSRWQIYRLKFLRRNIPLLIRPELWQPL